MYLILYGGAIMLKNGVWVKTIVFGGKTEESPCERHSYHHNGKMPCTGIRTCLLCGKPQDDTEEQTATTKRGH